MIIRSELFWDIDMRNFDYDRNKTLIIERVLNYGTLTEFREILHYYGFDTIRRELKKAGHLELKTMEFVSSFFQLKKESLRCYTRKQLNQPHWN